MDIKSNKDIVLKVTHTFLKVLDLSKMISEFALEYYFKENNIVHILNEKTYLRMLTFQIGCYLEYGIRDSKRIPRKRRGKRHKVKYTTPSLIYDNTGYFRNYTDAKKIVQDDCLNCCCMIMPGKPFDLENGKPIRINVATYKLKIKMEHQFPFPDSRIQIFYSRYPNWEHSYDVWGFVPSDPKFMCRFYP